MTTATAGTKAVPSPEKEKSEKEKMEKRRALGRGLESLLPRPKVVPPTPAPIQTEEQIPHFVRNDNPSVAVVPAEAGAAPIQQEQGGSRAEASAVIPMMQAVVETRSQSGGSEIGPAHAGVLHTDGSQALAPAAAEEITILAQAEARLPGNLVANLPIENIDKNPFQTRYVRNDDALEELAESIKVNGVVQPIVVRPAEEEGRYILILGERRLHASKKAGKETIPAIVRRVSEQQAAEMTIVENLQRQDLSPLEQAEAFRVLSQEFKLTQAEIGARVGLSRESISNYMRLLRLPREVMQLLAEKKINFAEAKELLKLEDDRKIVDAALYAVKHGMTVEQVERLVLRMNGWLDSFPGMPGEERKKSGARWVDPNVRSAQLELERLLGMRVRIRDRSGKGKIVIEYATVDDYDRVLEALRGKK